MTQFHLKPRTTRQPQDTIDGHTRPSTRLVDGHTRLVTIDWRLSCDFHVHLASWFGTCSSLPVDREVDRCDKDEMTSSYNLDKLARCLTVIRLEVTVDR